MVQQKIKKSIGTSGLADVRPLRNSLRVIFQDGDQYEVKNEGWDRAAGKFIVTLNQQNDAILYASPAAGTYLVTFLEFGNRTGGIAAGQPRDAGIPEPYIKRGGPRKSPQGGTFIAPDELTFSSKLQVVEKGIYNGLNIVYSLPYGFVAQPGTPFTAIEASSKKLDRIATFLRTAGLDLTNDEIPYSDNVLPWLEKRLQNAGAVFSVTLNEKGFVSTITEIPSYLIPGDLKKKAKKPVKSAKPAKKAKAAKK